MTTALDQNKIRILHALYLHSGKPLSGVALSKKLKISRVAIWKHIKAIKDAGFDIQSGPKGYTLNHPEDLLLPVCFDKPWQDRVHHFPVVESTMDEARILARKGEPHLSVVIAEEQQAGRGRMDRKWFSTKGGLWFTLIIRPEQMPPMMSYIYNFAAAVSLSRSLTKLFDLDISVKWPNDLLLGTKKLSGLLSEMETRGDLVDFINIGIGVNINNQPQEDEPRAISIRSALRRKVGRKRVLETFLNDFKDLIRDPDPGLIIPLWKSHTSTIGNKVKIQTLTDVYEGTALDVGEDGALVIEDNHGKTRRIIYGDCFHS